MKSSDIFRLSTDSLANRGLRSWLTILGIVIGVASVVTILAIGSGATTAISSQLGGLGADVLTISAGSGRAVFAGGGVPGGLPLATSVHFAFGSSGFGSVVS